jgi:hypothetical protein
VIERDCSVKKGGRRHEATWMTWVKGLCHSTVTVLAVIIEELKYF